MGVGVGVCVLRSIVSSPLPSHVMSCCLLFVCSFDESYEPTYENSFSRVFQHDGRDVDIYIKDTQGLAEQVLHTNTTHTHTESTPTLEPATVGTCGISAPCTTMPGAADTSRLGECSQLSACTCLLVCRLRCCCACSVVCVCVAVAVVLLGSVSC